MMDYYDGMGLSTLNEHMSHRHMINNFYFSVCVCTVNLLLKLSAVDM